MLSVVHYLSVALLIARALLLEIKPYSKSLRALALTLFLSLTVAILILALAFLDSFIYAKQSSTIESVLALETVDAILMLIVCPAWTGISTSLLIETSATPAPLVVT